MILTERDLDEISLVYPLPNCWKFRLPSAVERPLNPWTLNTFTIHFDSLKRRSSEKKKGGEKELNEAEEAGKQKEVEVGSEWRLEEEGTRSDIVKIEDNGSEQMIDGFFGTDLAVTLITREDVMGTEYKGQTGEEAMEKEMKSEVVVEVLSNVMVVWKKVVSEVVETHKVSKDLATTGDIMYSLEDSTTVAGAIDSLW
ncbi:hypothetical protein Dimus_010494 [Dionaea muscipula]